MSISLDTIVLVRFFARDDIDQYQRVATVLASRLCHVQDTVILELEWVLRKTFRYDRNAIAAVFDVMTNLENLLLDDPDRLSKALRGYREGLDFADAFHLAGAFRHHTFMTFDLDLIKKAPHSFNQPTVTHP